MTNKNIILTSALALILFQTPIHARVYKWVDDNGQVHYGERPGNTAAEQITIRKNETTTPRKIKKDDKEGENAKNNEKTDEKPKEGPLVPVEISKKEKRKLCNEAKSDYTAISNRGRMREINAKGEYIYLNEKQRQKLLTDAKAKQRKYCR